MRKQGIRSRLKEERVIRVFCQGFLIGLYALVFLLSGCSSGQLSFNMIDHGNSSAYLGKDPQLIVIATLDELHAWMKNVGLKYPLDAKAENVDFDRAFILLLLSGYHSNNDFDVDIQKVTRSGSEVKVFASFTRPVPEQLILPGSCSPYHLVSVSNEGTWGIDITFTVLDTSWDEPVIVLQTTHFIPAGKKK